jgi:hypothetical protein
MMNAKLTQLSDWFSLKNLIDQMRRAMREGRDFLFTIESDDK